MDLAETRKYHLALVIISAFLIIILYWSFHPPQLPGDVAGGVIGAFLLQIGAIGNHFFKVLTDKEVKSGNSN